MKGCFVTGTDTGVGKTLVTLGLIEALKSRFKVGAVKPVETGVPDGDRGDDLRSLNVSPALTTTDGFRLHRAINVGWTQKDVCPFSFSLPAAPEVAAPRPIDLDALVTHVRRQSERCDIIIIEGAGGLLVPLAPGYSMAELAGELSLPLVIVGRTALGTINHTLLTVEAARRRKLEVAAIVLSSTQPVAGAEEGSTPAIIARETNVPVFALPHVPSAAADILARSLNPVADRLLAANKATFP